MTTTVASPPIPRPVSRSPDAGWWRATLARVRSWSYGASPEGGGKRDYRVDLLRGFATFAMVVDHLGGDSWLYAITGGNRFYVSAAEGFIFISGLVMGQAYAARVQRSGLVNAMMDALRRARTLYVATVVMTLIFSALYLWTDISLWTSRDFGLGIESVDEIIVGALTLHYTYHGTDILAMYTVLIMVAPLVFLLLTLGQWKVVLGVSWLWWAAYQAYPEQATFPWYIRHAENFPIGAWQVLFLTGIVLGFHRDQVEVFLRRWRTLQLLAVSLGIALTLGLISLFLGAQSGTPLQFGFFDVDPTALDERFFKVALRPWRLVAFAAVGIVLYTVTTYFWVPIRRALGWLLLPLGQHALYAYIVHFFLILLIYNLIPLFQPQASELLSTTLQLILVMVLWLMVKKRFLFRIIPN